MGAAAVQDWPESGLGYLIAGDNERSITDCLAPLAEGRHEILIEPLPEPETRHFTQQAPEDLGPALVSTREAREDWWIASYSAIEYRDMAGTGIAFSGEVEDAQTQNLLEESAQQTEEEGVVARPATRNQHQFPRGAAPGTFLHELLEWCAQQGFDRIMENPDALRQQLARRCLSLIHI